MTRNPGAPQTENPLTDSVRAGIGPPELPAPAVIGPGGTLPASSCSNGRSGSCSTPTCVLRLRGRRSGRVVTPAIARLGDSRPRSVMTMVPVSRPVRV